MTRSAVSLLITLLAEELAGHGILANAYCQPETTGGAPGAAVETPIWLATLPDDGPTGRIYG